MCKITLYELTTGNLSNDGISSVLVSNYKERTREIVLKADFRGKARLFILEETRGTPTWFRYLTPILQNEDETLESSVSLGGLLLIKPDEDSRFYAAAWGSARFLLRQEKLKPDLGIKCALNMLCGDGTQWQPDCIRSIASKRIDANTLNSQFQYARLAPFEAFPFIVDTDQLRQVTGAPLDRTKWGTITGGVSINFLAPKDAAGIVAVCREIENIRSKRFYRDHFDFVDTIQAVTEESILTILQRKVVSNIESGGTSSFFLSPPENLDWATIAKFQYLYIPEADGDSARGGTVEKSMDVEDPDIDSLLEFIKSPAILANLESLLFSDALSIIAIDDNGKTVNSWPILYWLGCELSEQNVKGETVQHYILDAGRFFIIEPDFMNALNKFVADSEITQTTDIEPYTLDPALVRIKPKWMEKESADTAEKAQAKGSKEYPEDNYVNALVKKNQTDSLRLHKRLVSEKKNIKGITTPTESGCLSHLFSQALVSAQLLEANQKFRTLAGEVVSKSKDEDGGYNSRLDSFKWLSLDSLDPRQVTVVMGMITADARPLAEALPFFSKVNYRMRCQDLSRMGYRYKMVKIPYVAKV